MGPLNKLNPVFVNDRARQLAAVAPNFDAWSTEACVSRGEAPACLSVRSLNRPRGARKKLGI